MPLTLEIVTPEARVYSDVIETVVIPTVEGEIGILPGHIPLLTQVEAGELRVSKNGRTEYLAVGNGFAQIDGDKVSVLAESAIDEAKIDEDAVAKAQARAEEALRTRESMDPAEVERLEGVVRFSIAQLGVKRRRK
ncbi:ATP synthase F1 subunit epsilon [Nibricoccus aquaticus]|uniref:ATP synthase epsilon chain n=1 Tax=Nibricoccus aquaticus TaxID=2576891 RepID=A0A290Q5R4_9BACT|nr:ATP synthase F1 subunit epsilon [Nibricoccus aquaticus]ATC64029.1 ATP synthase F1 subunit epsilon [Nibricoccus aquaticus]